MGGGGGGGGGHLSKIVSIFYVLNSKIFSIFYVLNSKNRVFNQYFLIARVCRHIKVFTYP